MVLFLTWAVLFHGSRKVEICKATKYQPTKQTKLIFYRWRPHVQYWSQLLLTKNKGYSSYCCDLKYMKQKIVLHPKKKNKQKKNLPILLIFPTLNNKAADPMKWYNKSYLALDYRFHIHVLDSEYQLSVCTLSKK